MNRQSTHWQRSRAWLAAGLAVFALSGCVVAPVGEPYYDSGSTYYDGGYYGGASYYPTEVVPVAPYAGAIWINGYWDNSRGRRHWVPGRYEHPRPGWRPNRPGSNRPDGNRPGWNRPDGNRPGWNRPNARPPSGNARPPSGNVRPPSGNVPHPGRMENLRTRPGPHRNPGA